MKEETSWTLKGVEQFSGDLIFDENEMSIQRDLRSLWMHIVIAFGIMLSLIGNGMNSLEKGHQIFFYVCCFFVIALFVLLAFEFSRLLNARLRNKRVYPISEIKKVQAEIKYYRVWLTIEFKNETRDKISIIKNSYYSKFIEIMKTNRIDVFENNKR